MRRRNFLWKSVNFVEEWTILKEDGNENKEEKVFVSRNSKKVEENVFLSRNFKKVEEKVLKKGKKGEQLK